MKKPISTSNGIHCVNCVLDQVEHDLLQLAPVAHDKRQFRRQRRASYNAVIIQLSAQTAQRLERVIHVY